MNLQVSEVDRPLATLGRTSEVAGVYVFLIVCYLQCEIIN